MELNDFRATIGWSQRFMKRHGLAMHLCTHLAQRIPDEFEEILRFQRTMIRQEWNMATTYSTLPTWMKHRCLLTCHLLGLSVIPAGIVLHINPKGWMVESGMKLWIQKVWNGWPGGLLKPRSMLVMDTFRAHMTDAVTKRLENENTDVVWIPGGLTSQLRPLDVSMNKPLKDAVRTMWMEWMMDEQSHQYTATGRLKRPSITVVCQWIKNAWEAIDPQLLS